MRKLYILLVIPMLLLLSGCIFQNSGVTEGDSIEDCMTQTYCEYKDKNARFEGSEYAGSLYELVLEEDDVIRFSYIVNPSGDTMIVRYESASDINDDLIDDILVLLAEAQLITGIYYEVDNIHLTLITDDYVFLEATYENDMDVEEVNVILGYNVVYDDFSTENVISRIESVESSLLTIIDNEHITQIEIYDYQSNTVVAEYEGDNDITITLSRNTNKDTIKTHLISTLSGYSITFETE